MQKRPATVFNETAAKNTKHYHNTTVQLLLIKTRDSIRNQMVTTQRVWPLKDKWPDSGLKSNTCGHLWIFVQDHQNWWTDLWWILGGNDDHQHKTTVMEDVEKMKFEMLGQTAAQEASSSQWCSVFTHLQLLLLSPAATWHSLLKWNVVCMIKCVCVRAGFSHAGGLSMWLCT